MHEMGVVIQIIKTANDFAEKNKVNKVKKLTVQIGEMNAVMPQYVRMFFGDVIPDYPLMQGCELVIESEEPVAFCLGCGESFNPLATRNVCPSCRSHSYKLLQGESLMIKDMEVE